MGVDITAASAEGIRQQLSRILKSRAFSGSERLKGFLEFVVEQCLNQASGHLKEVAVAAAVFGKSNNFNPRIETTVRTAAHRLRAKLNRYYENEGVDDPIRISLPSGHYVPDFMFRKVKAVDPSASGFRRNIARNLPGILVGRESELARLRRRMDLVVNGRGGMLCVVAEPGVGKSALVETFLNDATDASDTFHAVGRCRQELERSEPYLPWLDAVDELVSQDDSVAALMESVSPTWWNYLKRGTPNALLREVATVKRELLRFLQCLSQSQPVVVFIDDLHWADPSTLDLLAYLGPSVPSMKLLLIVAYRPSDLVLRKSAFLEIEAELRMRGVYETLALPELDVRATRSYLDFRFPGHSFSPGFVQSLQARTGGNPLCLTALAGHAVARGWIVKEGSNWRIGFDPSQWGSDLPRSILGMIAKKMDELCEADRDVLYASALLGTQFESAVISRALHFDGAAVEQRLGHLERAHHVLRYLREARLTDGTWTQCYRFDHPLYRDALLKDLGPERRRRLCRPIAEAVIAIHAEAEKSLAHTVAALFEEAGAVAPALSYYVRAALNAAQMSAYKQVSDVTKRAADLARRARRTRSIAVSEIQLLTLQAVSAANLGGWDAPELNRMYHRAQAAGRALGDASAALNVGHVYCTYMSSIDCRRGRRIADSLQRTACASKKPQPIASATMTNGVTHLNLGQIAKAVSLLRKARRLCERIKEPPTFLTFPVPPQVATHGLLARALWFSGRPREASETSLRGVEVARKLGHERTLAYASALAADVAHLRRDAAETLRWAEAAIALAQEHELRYERIWASSWRAWALAETGDPNAAISIFKQFLECYRGPGTVIMQCHYADALARMGDLSGAVKALDRAFAIMGDQGETYFESELHRLRGELWLMREQVTVTDIQSAVRLFSSARAIAHRQGAKSCELRAAISLARTALNFRLPRLDKALRALEGIFKELRQWGETIDLAEARDLLEH